MSKLAYLIRKRQGMSLVLSSYEHFLFGAIAKALATIATYPYQVVKSRLQAESTAKLYSGTFDATVKMLRTEGLYVFFLGMEAKMYQTVLNSAFLFVVYEKLVGVYLSALGLAWENIPGYRTLFLIILALSVVLWRIALRIKRGVNKGST